MSRPTTLISAAALASLLPLTATVPASAADPVEPTSSIAGDAFFAYERPATYGVHVSDARVPLRDGSHLACRLHRPAAASGAPATGRFPGIVYEYTAYAENAEAFSTDLEYFVRRGYEGVVCQVRGSGASPGVIDPFGPQEQRDNVDLIEWLATRPSSTGRIGQMGLSYGGHTTLLAAVNRPKHLVAIIPINGISDWYENTIYRGGIRSPRIQTWQKEVAPNTLTTYAQHPLHDAFWDARSVASRWDDLDVPTLEINGWYDRYRDGMVKNHLARPDNVWMVSGPWEHGYPSSQRAPIDQRPYLAWWDHWLKQDPKAPLPRTKITSFEISSQNHSTGWHQYAAWPPSSRTIDFALGARGDLARRAGFPEERSYDVNTSDSPATPAQRLDFTTAPQRRDLVIAGSPRLELDTTFTATDGNIAAVLEDVAPDGRRSRITQGWLKASHREGHEQLAAVVPGTSYRMSVEIWPTHYRLPAGHRLGLRVSSDDYPEIASDAPKGRVTVEVGRGGSTLELPVSGRGTR